MPPAPVSSGAVVAEEARAASAALDTIAAAPLGPAAENAPPQSAAHDGGHARGGLGWVSAAAAATADCSAAALVAVAMRTATAAVAADAESSSIVSVRSPHEPEASTDDWHSAEKDGVKMLSIEPSGDTQFSVAGALPTTMTVDALNAAPDDAGGGVVATRIRCVEPDSVRAQRDDAGV